MAQRVKAVYRDRAFTLSERLNLREGTEVELEVHPTAIPPAVTDPEERAKILREVVESMRNNPIPADAPRYTRDEWHERR